jgi:hypothetical protein
MKTTIAPSPTLAMVTAYDWHLCLHNAASLLCPQLPSCHEWYWRSLGGPPWSTSYLLQTHSIHFPWPWHHCLAQNHHKKSTKDRYNDLLLAATTNDDMPYEDFHEANVKAGAETALAVQSKNDDWFLFNQDHIVPPNC